jgi:hypothetical protein
MSLQNLETVVCIDDRTPLDRGALLIVSLSHCLFPLCKRS